MPEELAAALGDDTCYAEGLRIPMSLVMTTTHEELGLPEEQDFLDAYPIYELGKDPVIVLAEDESEGWHLTITEARALASALSTAADQAEAVKR